MSMSCPSWKALPFQWKWASRSLGARTCRVPTMKRRCALSSAVRLAAESIPGVSHDDELLDAVSSLEGLHDGDDGGGLSLVPFPAAESQGETITVDQQAGVDLMLLGVSDLAQLVLLLGLEVQGGHVVQTQRQPPPALVTCSNKAFDRLSQ